MADGTLDQIGTIGAKIAMIKAIRTFTGLGLLESKLISDAIGTTYCPDKVTPPDTHHTHSAHAVRLAKDSVCLHCGAPLPRVHWGAIFCSTQCFESHRTDTRQENQVYLVDREIESMEGQLRDLRQRRLDLLNKD